MKKECIIYRPMIFLERREMDFKAFEKGIFLLIEDDYSRKSEQPERSE